MKKIITTAKLVELLKKHSDEYVFVDVRTPGEFSEERIEGFVNIPNEDICSRFESELAGKKIVISCQAGGRAEMAATSCLKKHPESEIWVYSDSLSGWKLAGGKTIRAPKKYSIDQQMFLVIGGVLIISFFLPFGRFVTAFVGCGLVFAALSGICLLRLVIARMPWNR